jgi:putative aldouronate transport system substrate-binding protein
MKKIERIPVLAAFILALVFLSGTPVFAGARGQQAGEAAAVPAGKETLVIGLQGSSFVTDYENNYLTQYIEKLHNIDLDFYLLPNDGNEARTKISLMVASNDLSDVICGGGLSAEQILDYGVKGAFIPLNRYYNDPVKAPNFAKINPEDKTLILNAITSADGNIYSFPRFEPEIWNLTPHRIYVNRTWIDKLGLKVPVTTDELRSVLLAFRDGDPNGNGRKDEIGAYGYFGGTYGENLVSALINSFIFYNHVDLALDGTGAKVIAPFTEPNFRKALVYLNTLYRDGVLAASTFTDDSQQFRATLNSDPPVVGLTSAGSGGNWPNQNTNKNFLELEFVPPFTGPDGIKYTPYTDYVPQQMAYITSKSKNPDLAFKVMESFLDIDLALIARLGEEGVDWTRDPEILSRDFVSSFVELGVYPRIFRGTLSTMWSEPSNKNWHNINPRYVTWEIANGNGTLKTQFDPSISSSYAGVYNYQWYVPAHPKFVLPQLKYTVEETSKISESIANVKEFVKQGIAEFSTGIKDINSDTAWNTYVRELNNMGLQGWISAAQASYNRIRR